MNAPLVLERSDLDSLLQALREGGYEVVGPTLGEGAIVYGPVTSSSDFPVGWTEVQDGGSYRLQKRDDEAVFGFTVGPQSWKQYLHPPRRKMWSGSLDGNGFRLEPEPPSPVAHAFFGVRSCELSAIEIQDRVFIHDQFSNPDYQDRREKALVIVVQCGQAAKTCFCTSMNTGPKAESGFDLALTEILEDDRHYFWVEPGSERGQKIIEKVPVRQAEDNESQAAQGAWEKARSQMGRNMDTEGLHDILFNNLQHNRWQEIAGRCLSCANCTMVCPTCFCSTVEDTTDVTGDHTERWLRWDSCFTMEFSNLHGGSVRSSTASQYRQWMTHKLASWQDQFDTSGCVGCGRCITWCPVGIDLTAEVRFFRELTPHDPQAPITQEAKDEKS